MRSKNRFHRKGSGLIKTFRTVLFSMLYKGKLRHSSQQLVDQIKVVVIQLDRSWLPAPVFLSLKPVLYLLCYKLLHTIKAWNKTCSEYLHNLFGNILQWLLCMKKTLTVLGTCIIYQTERWMHWLGSYVLGRMWRASGIGCFDCLHLPTCGLHRDLSAALHH